MFVAIDQLALNRSRVFSHVDPADSPLRGRAQKTLEAVKRSRGRSSAAAVSKRHYRTRRSRVFVRVGEKNPNRPPLVCHTSTDVVGDDKKY